MSDEHESDVDEDDLPMFENEDAPPVMDYGKGFVVIMGVWRFRNEDNFVHK